MATDTSSSAAASTPVVRAAAAALAELIVEPRLAKSVAVVPSTSGTATTNHISDLPTGHDNLTGVRSSAMPPASCSLTPRDQTNGLRLHFHFAFGRLCSPRGPPGHVALRYKGN